jgi:hypothetical protein
VDPILLVLLLLLLPLLLLFRRTDDDGDGDDLVGIDRLAEEGDLLADVGIV